MLGIQRLCSIVALFYEGAAAAALAAAAAAAVVVVAAAAAVMVVVAEIAAALAVAAASVAVAVVAVEASAKQPRKGTCQAVAKHTCMTCSGSKLLYIQLKGFVLRGLSWFAH